MLANNKLSTWVTLRFTVCVRGCIMDFLMLDSQQFSSCFFFSSFVSKSFLYIFHHISISSAGVFVSKLAHNWWCATELDKIIDVPLFVSIRSNSIRFDLIQEYNFPWISSFYFSCNLHQNLTIPLKCTNSICATIESFRMFEHWLNVKALSIKCNITAVHYYRYWFLFLVENLYLDCV